MCIPSVLNYQISVPPLFYPPWRKDINSPQTLDQIELSDEDAAKLDEEGDRHGEDGADVTFAHGRCSVSPQYSYLV